MSFEVGKRAFLVFALSLVLFLFASWRARQLPGSSSLKAASNSSRGNFVAPLQTPLLPSEPKLIQLDRNGHHYDLRPKFRYRLQGVIVSMSDTSSWQNITHAGANDFINSNDLCVVWGENAASLDLQKFDFSNGDWTCYLYTKSREAFETFDMNALSNNHIVPSSNAVAKAVGRSRIGDHVEMDGYLVDYSIDGHDARHTSVSRDDTGNGACEVVYAETFRLLKRPNAFLHKTADVAKWLAVASFLVGFFAMFLMPFAAPLLAPLFGLTAPAE